MGCRIGNALVILVIGITIPLCVGAADFETDKRWVPLKFKSAKHLMYYDSQSIIQKGASGKIWIASIPPVTLYKNSDDKQVTVSHTLFLYSINCSDRTFSYVKEMTYFSDGTHQEVDGKKEWWEIEPNSFGEAMFNKVCK